MENSQNLTPAPTVAQPQGGRIRTGWTLFKGSWRLLRSDKTIFRFIIVSGFFSFILLAIYVAVMAVGRHDFIRTTSSTYTTNGTSGGKQTILTPLGLIPTIIYYILAFLIVNLYAAGIVTNLIERFKGNKVSYQDSMKVAWSRFGKLLAYSIIEATVGLFLRVIAERSRLLGKLSAAIAGVAWSIARLFAVPIIVNDNEGPIPAIKDSSKLLIATWGENISGRVSMGSALFLVGLLVMVPLIIVFALLGGLIGGSVGAVVAGVLILLMVLAYIIISNAANSVLNVALYYYAKYRQFPPDYDPNLINSVFRHKNKTLI